MKKILLKRPSIFLISFCVVLIDQLSKNWAIAILSNKSSLPFIPGLIQFHLVKNNGAAFSLLSGATPLLGLLSLIVSIGLITWIYRVKKLLLWKALAVSFLLGGSIGNGIDRWCYGYVNDFIELIPINFPIFNAADIAINLAVLCLIIDNVTVVNSYNSN